MDMSRLTPPAFALPGLTERGNASPSGILNQGVPKTVANKDTEYRMRRRHAQLQRPRAKSSRFLKKKGANFRKAAVAKTAAGNAKKLLDIKSGAAGQRECEILQLPALTKGKHVRRFVDQLFCKK